MEGSGTLRGLTVGLNVRSSGRVRPQPVFDNPAVLFTLDRSSSVVTDFVSGIVRILQIIPTEYNPNRVGIFLTWCTHEGSDVENSEGDWGYPHMPMIRWLVDHGDRK